MSQESPLTLLVEARLQQGYSCSQAVFSVLGEKLGVDPALSLRVAAGFGGGLARSGGACGCVTGAVMAIGLLQQDISPQGNREAKELTYAAAHRFIREFARRNGSIQCPDLLGCDISTPAGLALAREKGLFQQRCPALMREAVTLFEELFPAASASPSP
jgi:C_GCAxxG_C_C family probable redox protein